MSLRLLATTCMLALLAQACAAHGGKGWRWQRGMPPPPYAIGHRGMCGVFPEHTIPSYQGAIDAGADFIECDVVPTKDCALICRHEPELGLTTDALQKFPGKIRTINIDGSNYTGVFSFDLTLAEIKTLRAKQQMAIRDQSMNFLYEVPTFEEHIKLAQRQSRVVGIYPETKHPSFHDSLQLSCFNGKSFTDAVIDTLNKYGYSDPVNSPRWRRRPAFLQSFERKNLLASTSKTKLPMVFLTDEFSLTIPYDTKTYGQVLQSDADLSQLYAGGIRGIGPWKNTLVAFQSNNYLNVSTIPAGKALVKRLHNAGFQVHIYTLRNEPKRADGSGYLAWDYRSDAVNEYDLFYNELNIDGAFTDFAETLARWLGKTE